MYVPNAGSVCGKEFVCVCECACLYPTQAVYVRESLCVCEYVCVFVPEAGIGSVAASRTMVELFFAGTPPAMSGATAMASWLVPIGPGSCASGADGTVAAALALGRAAAGRNPHRSDV